VVRVISFLFRHGKGRQAWPLAQAWHGQQTAPARPAHSKQDLDPDELDAYRDLAKAYLALAECAMDNYVADGVLSEVAYDEQKDQDR